MYSVYQHWDPLKVCVVGRAYSPKFFNWVSDVGTRQRLQRMAEETEEDLQNLILLLKSFSIEILRPMYPVDLEPDFYRHGRWVSPAITPRDYFLMIHNDLWVPSVPNRAYADRAFARQDEIDRAEFDQRDKEQHFIKLNCYNNILQHVINQGNQVRYTGLDVVSGCFVSRIGENLYFATQSYDEDQIKLKTSVDQLFPKTNNRIVNAGGHGDATYCPVAPGLIISLKDVSTYADTFPGWEVVYLPSSDYAEVAEFQQSMKINRGRWFIPGFDQDQNLVNIVEHYFDSWVGNVSETVFDVNILVIDQKNIIVSSHNQQVEDACARYGITVHVSPFRHRYFWDAGIHCVTNDLHRDGQLGKHV
jgi:hypothetical protein